MDMQQLRFFVAVAKYGKIQRAADALFVSRQAVSKALIQLEEELQYPLFHRAHSGVTPSVQALAFLDRANALVADYDTLCAQMINLNARFTLRIALPFTVHHGFFDPIETFCQAHAHEAEIDLISRTDAQCHTLFESGAVDMAVSHMRFASGIDDGELIASSPICIAVSKAHPLAGERLITSEMLRGTPVIYYMNGYRELSWLARPDADYAVNDILLALDLVRRGRGAFPIPRISMPEGMNDIVLAPYQGPDDKDDFWCAIADHTRKDGRLLRMCMDLRCALAEKREK